MLGSAIFGQELHTHRFRNLYRKPHRRQFAIFRIDPEGHDTVVILVGYQEVGTRWINAEISWRLDLMRLMSNRGQFACFYIDGEDGDAVMAAVRSIEEIAGWMDLYFGCEAFSLEVLGKRGNRLQGG